MNEVYGRHKEDRDSKLNPEQRAQCTDTPALQLAITICASPLTRNMACSLQISERRLRLHCVYSSFEVTEVFDIFARHQCRFLHGDDAK
jgi:hypothetical protein